MKIRTFENMCDSVFRVVVNTEDFSQDDLRLMCQFGEPEINFGGTVTYEFEDVSKTKEIGDQYVRVFHGFPLAFGFDSRDFEGGSIDEAIAVGRAWKTGVIEKITHAIGDLRSKAKVLPTEEVTNV